jgi:hypothetical protein
MKIVKLFVVRLSLLVANFDRRLLAVKAFDEDFVLMHIVVFERFLLLLFLVFFFYLKMNVYDVFENKQDW